MTTNPYTKRVAQGAAQGALAGGTAGFMLGGPVVGALGLATGGLAGGLLSRPGDDERNLRARMRKLEMGVLGDEEAAIMNRFMDPVRGAAQQQEVSRRALEQGTVTSGAAARRAQAAQRGARRDLREAAQEATLAVMDLGERRRMQAQRINERLLGEENRRDQAFRQGMVSGAINAAGLVGGALGERRALGELEAANLPGAAANAADVAAMSDDELLERYASTRQPTATPASFTEEDVVGLQLGGGLAPMRATPTRADIEALTPAIEEGLRDLSGRTGLPLGTAGLQAPGSTRAMGTSFASRGSMFQPAAEPLGGGVAPAGEPSLTLREQRDVERIGAIFDITGDDSLYSLMELDGTLQDVLDMPGSEFNEYMAGFLPLFGQLQTAQEL